jgi:hypothetical protein
MYQYVLGCTNLPDPVQVYRIPDGHKQHQQHQGSSFVTHLGLEPGGTLVTWGGAALA